MRLIQRARRCRRRLCQPALADAAGQAHATAPQNLMQAVAGVVSLSATGTPALGQRAPDGLAPGQRQMQALVASGVRSVAQGAQATALRLPGVQPARGLAKGVDLRADLVARLAAGAVAPRPARACSR